MFDKNLHRILFFCWLTFAGNLSLAALDSADATTPKLNSKLKTASDTEAKIEGPIAPSDTLTKTETHATGTTSYTATATPNTALVTSDAQDTFNILNNFLNEIEIQEAINGAYDENLAETFYGLGKTLQRLNRHEDAIDAFKHSMHVNRVNHGMHSVTQAPMMQGVIESQKQLGGVVEITKQYYQLLWTYEKFYGADSSELLPLLNEASDWHRDTYLANKTPAYLSHLLNSLSLTDSAVEISSRTYGSDNPELITPLKKLALNSYYLAEYYMLYPNDKMYSQGEPPINYQFLTPITNEHGNKSNNFAHNDQFGFVSYKSGRYAYLKLIDVLQKSNASIAEQAQAMAGLGDWMLIFNKKDSADRFYRMAWDLLNETGDVSANEDLFGAPKLIPNTSYLKSETAQNDSQKLDPERFVKISFFVSQRGSASNFSVLESRPADNNGLIKQARSLWRGFRFRARYENGQAVATSDHELVLNFN